MTLELQRRRWTVADFHRMDEGGFFRPDERVELIDGEVIEMSPIGPEHQNYVDWIADSLWPQVRPNAIVRVQGPILLSDASEPIPDLALLRARPGGFSPDHPRPADVLLVIEVADSSVTSDRQIKLPRYAEVGIPEAWIVNLRERMTEKYVNPMGRNYRQMTLIPFVDDVSTDAVPGLVINLEKPFARS